MKRRRDNRNKETWEDFEKRVGLKRTGGEDSMKKSLGKSPNDILVQRMSSTPSGRLKKYEPLDTRDFVPFGDYDELSVDNIKEACEQFYKAPAGACDILASDRGPSCTKIEQIKGKKVYFIRFLPPNDGNDQSNALVNNKKGVTEGEGHKVRSAPASPHKTKPAFESATSPPTVYPKSLSISDLMKAGKLVKPPKTAILELEYFDVQKCSWLTHNYSFRLQINEEKFSSGAFRNAFRARCNDPSSNLQGEWVVKKYKEGSIDIIKNDLKLTVEAHTRKQVQMHSVARNITQRFTSKVPPEFGPSFSYGKVFYSVLDDVPVTVEEYVPGEFMKYVNNDGHCPEAPTVETNELFAKAECLSHFSYEYSEGKLMVLDLQGSAYALYDPEIATTELCDDPEVSGEFYFCAGNLSRVGIDEFLLHHKCGNFCKLVGLTQA